MKNLIALILLVVALPVMAQNAPQGTQNANVGIRLTIIDPAVQNMPVQKHPLWPNAKIQRQDDTSIFQVVDGNSEQAYKWLRNTNANWHVSDDMAPNAQGEWVAQVNTPDQQCVKVHALQNADKSKVRIQTTACF